jgi:hypothetical protein
MDPADAVPYECLGFAQKLVRNFQAPIHPAWQGVETQEYQAYFEFSQRSQAGWIDV